MLEGAPGYVHDLPRDFGRFATLNKKSFLDRAIARRAVIVGGNAAAMEAIYTLRHEPDLLRLIHEILVISPRKFLPEGGPQRQHFFSASHLHRLNSCAAGLTADRLFEAAIADIEEARSAGLTSVDYSPPIIEAFRCAFAGMTQVERRRFVEQFGRRFDKLRRHTPPEYAAAARALTAHGKLRLKRGRVTAIVTAEMTKLGFTIAVSGPTGSRSVQAAFVFDCSGAQTLRDTSTPLLRSGFASGGFARINAAGIGIQVTESFEASPGIFVMGPLLAGHYSESSHIWALESTPRIDELARRVASTLAKQVFRKEHG
jgi:uncharacterized NAD(P)/FAD-binding protein YdhS